jgi:hypothetical protein
MTERIILSRAFNPLRKVSKELFEHGQKHASNKSSFDRLVAGVHIDNSLELFLKFHGVMNNIVGYDRKFVPELIRLLEPHIPELAEFGGDLRTFHDLRDGAYHMGQPLDEYILNWGIGKVKEFTDQVEDRERQTPRSLPDGGRKYPTQKQSKAEKELETAVSLFRQLQPSAQKEHMATIILHMFRAVEYWLDDRLKNKIRRQEISHMSLGKKIEILKEEIKDPILLGELRKVNELRNTMMHSREVRVEPSEVYRYLQVVMHFIKVKAPSDYITTPPGPLHRTLSGVCVRSKSEVIIANILTYLGVNFEYEKPLFSRSDPKERRAPDFTITHNGEKYYLEALSFSSPQYRRLWYRKKKWYEENNYSDRLIVIRETANGIDSKEIENLIRKRILK